MEHLSLFNPKLQDILRDNVQFLQIDIQDVKEPANIQETWIVHSSNLACSYCRCEFTDTAQQRQHYKLDWHRYNLKQSLLSRPPVTEEEFDDKTDISSISGSESDEKDEGLDNVMTSQGKMFLRNGNGVVISLYRCLLFDKKDELVNEVLSKSVAKCTPNMQCTILMLGGGHFAGAVFKANLPILHKTFHCYTVRAGQGGSQGTRDNKSASSQPKSAGASLRRYNESALIQHVADILDNWKEEIAKSDLIFYRAAGPYNHSVLFGGKVPYLNKTDSRLRTIPFSTRRATFTEVKRVQAVLTTVDVYDSLDAVLQHFPKNERSHKQTRSSASINRSKSREKIQRPLDAETHSTSSEEDSIDLHELSITEQEISFRNLETFGDSLALEERKNVQRRKRLSKTQRVEAKEAARKKEIYDAIKMGDLVKLEIMVKNLGESGLRSVNETLDDCGNSLLHVAAKYEEIDVIKFLLKQNADVCLKNNKQQTPYTCMQNVQVRNVFKDFAREFPDRYNYNKAQIPVSSSTPEEIEDKRKAQRKLKREKEKEKKKMNYVKKQEEEEKDRFLKLSDREKRALAAERRILTQTTQTVLARCFLCALDISGKVPFEYSGNRFCSIECLKAHRMQMPKL